MTPAEKMIAAVPVQPCELPDNITDGVPYATHSGILQIGEMKLEIFVLNTGQRIISKESVDAFFGNAE